MAVSSLEGILKPTFPIQLQSYFSLVFQKNQVSHPREPVSSMTLRKSFIFLDFGVLICMMGGIMTHTLPRTAPESMLVECCKGIANTVQICGARTDGSGWDRASYHKAMARRPGHREDGEGQGEGQVSPHPHQSCPGSPGPALLGSCVSGHHGHLPLELLGHHLFHFLLVPEFISSAV